MSQGRTPLQGEINDLLRERDDIGMWAAAPAK
jgi:hypothetical protein